MCWTSTQRLLCDPAAPRVARGFIADAIGMLPGSEASVEALRANAVLIASELVTNAVEAGCTDLEITVLVHRDRVRLSVSDDVARVPRMVTAGPDDLRGRGLALTEALAMVWGVDPQPVGKAVWAEFSVRVDRFETEPPTWCHEEPDDAESDADRDMEGGWLGREA